MGNSSVGHGKVVGLTPLAVIGPPLIQGLSTVATDEILVVVAAVTLPFSTS